MDSPTTRINMEQMWKGKKYDIYIWGKKMLYIFGEKKTAQAM